MGLGKKIFKSSSASAGAINPLENFETVTYTGNGATKKITGYIRKGAAFNGSSSKIVLSNYIVGDWNTGNQTISFWVKFNDFNNPLALFSQWFKDI